MICSITAPFKIPISISTLLISSLRSSTSSILSISHLIPLNPLLEPSQTRCASSLEASLRSILTILSTCSSTEALFLLVATPRNFHCSSSQGKGSGSSHLHTVA